MNKDIENKKNKADVIKHNYIVNSVGDANCIYIDRYKSLSDYEHERYYDCPYYSRMQNYEAKRKKFMIDFGYSNVSFVKPLLHNVSDADEFLLSHYHLDHYNGLEQFKDDSLLIERLYYPFIPKILNDEKLQFGILKYMHFGNILNCNILMNNDRRLINNIDIIKRKVIGLWLVALLMKKNKFDDFEYKPVYKGMSIFEDEYQVVWPPKEINYDDVSLRSLNTDISKIEEIINNEPEPIKKVWDVFNREPKFDDNQLLSVDNIEDFWVYIQELCLNDEHKNGISVLTDAISDVTNRFSVCLYKIGEFLFLGDLERAEVEQCIKQLYNDNGGTTKVKVKYLIAPHHGSNRHYWKEIEKYIEPEYVISSNGKKNALNYANDYIALAQKQAFCTYYGTFDSKTLNRNEP